MFTGTHDDRSERGGWAVVLLRAMIMTVETDRRVAMGFMGPPYRWPAHLFRCGALIVAALGAACARRHGCDQRLVFAPRAAGRVRPSHPAQTSAKERPGAGYGNAGSGTKPPLSAAKSRANAIKRSARCGPMRCRPAGSLSPVTPIGAVVADRFDWLARPATNTCGAFGTDLAWSLSRFTGRSLAAPEHLPLNKKTWRALLAAMPSPLSGSRVPRRVSPICPHRPHLSWRHRRRSTSSQLASTRAFSEVSSVPSHLPRRACMRTSVRVCMKTRTRRGLSGRRKSSIGDST